MQANLWRNCSACSLWQIGAIAATILAACISGTAVLAQQPTGHRSDAEAIFKGRPLSDWLRQLQDGKAKERQEAVRALGALGRRAAPAVPELIEALNAEDTEVREGALQALGAIGPPAKAAVPVLLQVLRSDQDPRYYGLAAEGLAIVAPQDDRVARSLGEQLLVRQNRRETWMATAAALFKLGAQVQDAVPYLRLALKDRDAERRNAVVNLLARAGPLAAVPLAEALTDEEENVRNGALFGFKMLGPDSREAIPMLKAVLQNKNFNIRSDAMKALAAVGPEGKLLLRPLLKDPDIHTRTAAANAWREMTPAPDQSGAARDERDRKPADTAPQALALSKPPPPVRVAATCKGWPVAYWLRRLTASHAEDRLAAVRALADLGPHAAVAVPDLLRALEDGDAQVRTGAIRALGKVGPAATQAVPVLHQWLKDKDKAQAILAIEALEGIGSDDERVVHALAQELLKQEDYDVRHAAAEALCRLGQKAQSAIPLLSEALKHKDQGRHGPAVIILTHMGPNAAVPLAQALQDEQESIRGIAMTGLQELGHGALEALPLLKKLVVEPDRAVRTPAIMALSGIVPQNVPILIPLLKHPDPQTRNAAALALLHAGPEAKSAAPMLIEALDDPITKDAASRCLHAIGAGATPELVKALCAGRARNAVEKIMRDLGPGAKEGIPALIAALKSDDQELQDAAAGILRTIRKDALAPLLEAAHDRDNERAHLVLTEMGPVARPAVPALRTMLKERNPELRRRAAQALGGAARRETAMRVPGIPAEETAPDPEVALAVRDLEAALKDANPGVRRQAAQSLGEIDPAAADRARKPGGSRSRAIPEFRQRERP